MISAPISSTAIRHIKHILADCHTFQIVAKSGQFIHYLQRFRIDFSYSSSVEGSIDISILSIDITNACTEVVVVYKRNTFQLHTRSIQLSQIIGTTYSYIYFIFILNHTLTKVTQLGVVLSLVNITDEIRILIGCIKGKSCVISSPTTLIQNINTRLRQCHLRPAVIQRIVIVVTTRCQRGTQSKHAEHTE